MNPASLDYSHLEKLHAVRPVDRLEYISSLCEGRVVLDIGCMDETALNKRGTGNWLHERIASRALAVVGLDSSAALPDEGLRTGTNSAIAKGDAMHISAMSLPRQDFDMVVAGEFIEHLPNPLEFLANLRQTLPGRKLLISTPNGVSAALLLMALLKREVQHPDHLHVYTYKTLNTLFKRAGFEHWDIVPYRFSSAELLLRTRGLAHLGARGGQAAFRAVEWCFPLLSHGYIVEALL